MGRRYVCRSRGATFRSGVRRLQTNSPDIPRMSGGLGTRVYQQMPRFCRYFVSAIGSLFDVTSGVRGVYCPFIVSPDGKRA